MGVDFEARYPFWRLPKLRHAQVAASANHMRSFVFEVCVCVVSLQIPAQVTMVEVPLGGGFIWKPPSTRYGLRWHELTEGRSGELPPGREGESLAKG